MVETFIQIVVVVQPLRLVVGVGEGIEQAIALVQAGGDHSVKRC